MPTIRLTQRRDREPHRRPLDDRLLDQTLPGFGVRVSKTSRKTFVVRYTHDGMKRRVTIGRYPAYGLGEARDKARDLIYYHGAGQTRA